MEQSSEHDTTKSSAETESTGIIDVIEFLSAKHSQMTFEYCMNEMTRPQLMIWFEQTADREHREMIGQEKQNWSKFANLMSLVANMAAKKKYKADDFMPEFKDKQDSNEELIEKAKEKGLDTPSEY